MSVRKTDSNSYLFLIAEYLRGIRDNTPMTVTDSSTVDLTLSAANLTAEVIDDSIGPDQLANTAVVASSYGSATQTGTFTVDAQGRLTAASNVTITPAASSITSPGALTKADDTNVTLTLTGTPATALLQSTLLTLGWSGQLSLARGGTNKNMTAVNGGVVWTDADSMEVSLAGTSGQLLQSNGAAAPTWVTALANGTTATTQSAGDSTTKVATTAFVTTAIADLEFILMNTYRFITGN